MLLQLPVSRRNGTKNKRVKKMKKLTNFFLIAFTFMMLFFNSCSSSSSPTSSGGGGGSTIPTATPNATQGGSSYTGGSIVIDSDDKFLPENGVVGGTGTSSDPYIIEGWTIDASNFDTSNWPYIKVSIAIGFTTKYFIIRNCTISNAGNYGAGISLGFVNNGKIENCTISNCGSGIVTQRCKNTVISNNIINNCEDGISNGSYSSEAIAISGNTISACSSHGVYFHYLSANSIVEKNIISGCGTGIYASALWFGGCIISENSVQNNSVGIEVSNDSEGNTITANIANNNTGPGIWILGSKNNITNNITNYNGTGIRIDPPIGGAAANENFINGNTGSNNQADGFYLGYDCINNIVSNNIFLNNNQSGGFYYDLKINNKNNILSNNTYMTIYIAP